MDVSVIIVNFNTKNLLENCLYSLYKYTKNINFEIIVSDNGSNDGSLEMIRSIFPEVILIENNKNLGFGAANNSGLKIAKGKYILYLNSDTVLLNNAVKYFYDYWESNRNEKIGALGCNLIDKNYSYMHSFGSFPIINNEIIFILKKIIKFNIKIVCHVLSLNTRIATRKLEKKYPYSGIVDYITGADLFVKNNEYAKFNELFFMYCEETYLQYNLKQKGLYSYIITGPQIMHLERASDQSYKKENIFSQYVSFSSIQNDFSKLVYFSLIHENRLKIFFLKLLLNIFWLHPVIHNFLYKNLKDKIKYKKLWSL
jgi:GT2 family glycosyltransferase